MLCAIMCLLTQHNGVGTLVAAWVLEATSVLALARLIVLQNMSLVCLESAQVFVTLICFVALTCTKIHLISLLHIRSLV